MKQPNWFMLANAVTGLGAGIVYCWRHQWHLGIGWILFGLGSVAMAWA